MPPQVGGDWSKPQTSENGAEKLYAEEAWWGRQQLDQWSEGDKPQVSFVELVHEQNGNQ